MNVGNSFIKVTLVILYVRTVFADGNTPHGSDGVNFNTSANSLPHMWELMLGAVQKTYVLMSTEVSNDLCRNHSRAYYNELYRMTPWAMQMYDSAPKLPASLLSGNMKHYGNFHECVGVNVALEDNYTVDDNNFRGQFCYADIDLPIDYVNETFFNFLKMGLGRNNETDFFHQVDTRWAFCIPSSCTAQDLNNVLQETIKPIINFMRVPVKPHVHTTHCYIQGKPPKVIDYWDYFMLSVIGIIGILVISGSALELFQKCRSCENKGDTKSSLVTILKAFSVITNYHRIFTTKVTDSSLAHLHGIRSLSMMWIMLGHSVFVLSHQALLSYVYLLETRHLIHVSLLVNGVFGVDTFFVLSGFLLSLFLLKELKKRKQFNLPLFYFHRIIRVAPAYFFVIWSMATIYPFLGYGPNWVNGTLTEQEYCRENMWANMLFINNIVNPRRMCLTPSWFVSTDMQLYLISPLLILPLWKKPKLGVFICLFFILASIAATFAVTYINELPALMVDLDLRSPVFILTYIQMYTRLGPYVVGVLLGFFLSQTEKKEYKVTKKYLFVGWIMCACTLLSILIASHPLTMYDRPINVLEASLFGAFHRTLWGLAIAWIIYACSTGHGGFVNSILCIKPFYVISRLTYCLFLTHFLVMKYYTLVTTATTESSLYAFIYLVWGHIITTLFISSLLSLAIEAPFINLQKIIINHLANANRVSNHHGDKEINECQNTELGNGNANQRKQESIAV